MSHGPMPAAHRAAITAGHARNRAGDSFLYVARCFDGDTVKIGCSSNPERRLQSWQVPSTILVCVKGGYPDERRLHQKIKAYRNGYGHEWYDAAVLNHPAVQAIFGQVSA